MTEVYFILCIILGVTECLEMIPTKHEISYINPKFAKDIVINVKREGRGRPYSIYGQGYLLQGIGDNVTVAFDTYENVQGRYIPLIFKMEIQLCKFYNEPIIGKLVVKQLPQNLTTCPISPGYYAGYYVLVLSENFPYQIPFTYASIYTSGKVDIRGFVTTTKEPIANVTFYGQVIQKPRNIKI